MRVNNIRSPEVDDKLNSGMRAPARRERKKFCCVLLPPAEREMEIMRRKSSATATDAPQQKVRCWEVHESGRRKLLKK